MAFINDVFRKIAALREKVGIDGPIQSAVFVSNIDSLTHVAGDSSAAVSCNALNIPYAHSSSVNFKSFAIAEPLCDGSGCYQIFECISSRPGLMSENSRHYTKTPITTGSDVVEPFLDRDQAIAALALWEKEMPSRGFTLSRNANTLPNHYSHRQVSDGSCRVREALPRA